MNRVRIFLIAQAASVRLLFLLFFQLFQLPGAVGLRQVFRIRVLKRFIFLGGVHPLEYPVVRVVPPSAADGFGYRIDMAVRQRFLQHGQGCGVRGFLHIHVALVQPQPLQAFHFRQGRQVRDFVPDEVQVHQVVQGGQAGNIRDCVLIQHSPVGCTARNLEFNLAFRNGLERRGIEPHNINIMTTNLLENDMVFGASEKLRKAAREAFGKKIAFAKGCEILGDDVHLPSFMGEKHYPSTPEEKEKLMAEEGLKTTPNHLIHIGMPIAFDNDEFIEN